MKKDCWKGGKAHDSSVANVAFDDEEDLLDDDIAL